jgi:hypothetical protein
LRQDGGNQLVHGRQRIAPFGQTKILQQAVVDEARVMLGLQIGR